MDILKADHSRDAKFDRRAFIAALGGSAIIATGCESAAPQHTSTTGVNAMAKVVFGNHAAVRVRLDERERIRRFYRDVLGCKLIRELDDKDDFRIGDSFHIAFLYASGRGGEVDKGVTYAAQDALSDDEFIKAIFLELKADNVDEMRQKVVIFGVKVLNVPDPHLYFQAPGGQVFRLVGINEDLSRYEGNG